jgi:hypothetical protein
MKRIALLVLACAIVPLASAQLYKYIDKDGKTVYTDQPPPDAEAKAMTHGSSSATTPKSYVERDKELQKGRDKVKEDAKKSDDKAKQVAERDAACRSATENAKMYEEGGRLMKPNAQGEREYLSDEEIEAARVKSRQEMEEACKKS